MLLLDDRTDAFLTNNAFIRLYSHQIKLLMIIRSKSCVYIKFLLKLCYVKAVLGVDQDGNGQKNPDSYLFENRYTLLSTACSVLYL